MFHYTVVVTNTSPESVTFDLSDTQWAGISGTLAAGESKTFNYDITQTEAGTYPNTATVTVTDNEGGTDTASDNETVTVTDTPPVVEIDKTVDPATITEPGGVFTFTLTIKNLGVEPFEITSLSDTNLASPYPAEVAALIGQTVPVGGSLSASYPITHTEAGSYGNTAVVTVKDNEGTTDTDDDTETVEVTDLAPTVTIDKSVTPATLAEPGGVFHYTVVVTNTSPESVTFELTDTQWAGATGTPRSRRVEDVHLRHHARRRGQLPQHRVGDGQGQRGQHGLRIRRRARHGDRRRSRRSTSPRVGRPSKLPWPGGSVHLHAHHQEHLDRAGHYHGPH